MAEDEKNETLQMMEGGGKGRIRWKMIKRGGGVMMMMPFTLEHVAAYLLPSSSTAVTVVLAVPVGAHLSFTFYSFDMGPPWPFALFVPRKGP
eukprot:416721-Rhodomonas_salina.2